LFLGEGSVCLSKFLVTVEVSVVVERMREEDKRERLERQYLLFTQPPVCYLTSTSNLTLLPYVRRLFTRLSDVAPSFIVVDASFAPGIFAPATVVCTQYLSICTRYLEYLGFSPRTPLH
jgi:hypothetical protein